MYIRNAKGFSAVFNIVSIFKSLPKNLILQLCGLSENNFETLLKKKAIFEYKNSYSLKKDIEPDYQLIKLAWVMASLEKVNYYSFMIKSLKPSVIAFLKLENDGSSSLNAVINYTIEDDVDLVRNMDFSDYKSLFFMVDEQSQTSLLMFLQKIEFTGKIYVLSVDEVNENNFTVAPKMSIKVVERS